jgi:hyaluronan synthase/N-acetylglucosaminyltransferase
MTGLFNDLMLRSLDILLIVYTVLVISHFVLQVGMAHRYYRQSLTRPAWRGPWPDVSIVIPVYNEDPDELRACFDSLLAQDYPGRVEVHIVDDLSPNRDQLMAVYEEYGRRAGWTIHLPEVNRGKRHAQDSALPYLRGSLVMTVDSDTRIASDGIRTIIEPFADPTVGAVTGDVRVSNRSRNLLTLLIDLRYWVAFNQERAAHSLFGAVLCCSGPFSVYRRDLLMRVWPRYVSQTFRGVACTFGDDRHLTNLILGEGYRTIFVPQAHCITSAPTTVPQYLTQQLRWNKSYYRELLWTLSFLPKLSRVMAVEVFIQALLPMLLTIAVAATIIRSLFYGPEVLVLYFTVIAVMAIMHCLYALYRTHDPKFLLFVLYGFLHAALLIPIRLRAIGSLTDNRWGTRSGPAAPSPAPVPVAAGA